MPEAFVLASGPSLRLDDVEHVKHWRSEDYSRFVVVTNNTWQLAPWADWLYACDSRWLRLYSREAKDGFHGRIWTTSTLGTNFGVTCARASGMRVFANSGTCAISLAIHQGATRIYLLGMDCQRTGGRTHWHADHPQPLTNAATLESWPADFDKCAQYAKGKRIEVLNCSRSTALRCFQRVDLEDALVSHLQAA